MINASIVLKLECICYIVVFLLVVEKHSILYKSLLTCLMLYNKHSLHFNLKITRD